MVLRQDMSLRGNILNMKMFWSLQFIGEQYISRLYLNGFKILEYLHEMCFMYYDFSFKKVSNAV